MDDPIAAAIARADKLEDELRFYEEKACLLEQKDSNNPEVLWRLARAYRGMSELPSERAVDKKEHIYRGFECAKQAVGLDDSNGACHQWFAIMLSDVSDYEGTKKSIENAWLVKEHCLKAIELCPKDATNHYLLGMWCYCLAEMSWMERQVAKAIYKSPPQANYQEALKHFEDAENMSPGFYCSNQLMIGRTYLAMKKKDKAKRWLDSAAAWNAVREDDKEAVKDAQALLKKEYGK